MIPSTLDFPAINGQPVTQAHADYCAANGHVAHVIAGMTQPHCPRCGERPAHEAACMARAVGCAVENIRDAAKSLDTDVSDWAAEADPVAEGARYLLEDLADCRCGSDLSGAQHWIDLGQAAIDRSAIVTPTPVAEQLVRREDVTGSVLWTPLAEATHAVRFPEGSGDWHPATEGDAHTFARMHGGANVATIAPDDELRIVEGTRYTQADAADRDQSADFAAALATADPLMHLHGLGYDCSSARIRTVEFDAPAVRSALCPTCGRSIGWNGHPYHPCTPTTR